MRLDIICGWLSNLVAFCQSKSKWPVRNCRSSEVLARGLVRDSCYPNSHRPKSAELVARADRLLKLCSLFGRDNKLLPCPTRREIIIAPLNKQIHYMLN